MIDEKVETGILLDDVPRLLEMRSAKDRRGQSLDSRDEPLGDWMGRTRDPEKNPTLFIYILSLKTMSWNLMITVVAFLLANIELSQPFVERGTLEHLYLSLRIKYEIFNFSSNYQHHATFIASKYYNIPPPIKMLPHFKNLLYFGEIGYKKTCILNYNTSHLYFHE